MLKYSQFINEAVVVIPPKILYPLAFSRDFFDCIRSGELRSNPISIELRRYRENYEHLYDISFIDISDKKGNISYILTSKIKDFAPNIYKNRNRYKPTNLQRRVIKEYGDTLFETGLRQDTKILQLHL